MVIEDIVSSICQVFYRSEGQSNDIGCDESVNNVLFNKSIANKQHFLNNILISHNQDPKTRTYLLINKANKSEQKYIDYNEDENKLLTTTCNRWHPCPNTTFFDQMNDTLVIKIESIVDYNISNRFVHILLFDINGRPKYCVQPDNQSLSQEVFLITIQH